MQREELISTEFLRNAGITGVEIRTIRDYIGDQVLNNNNTNIRQMIDVLFNRIPHLRRIIHIRRILREYIEAHIMAPRVPQRRAF